VSTDDQTEFSPDAQLKAIKNYARQNDIVLIQEHVYIDEGISGRKAEKRPQFMTMIATAKIKPRPFDVILVHKFDRFARSREDSVVYKSLLKKEAGIKVVSITESIEDDKFSVILEAMLEAMAEYYSLNLAEEVKKGMTEKAERGGYQTIAPFGYVMKNKKLEVLEEEGKIVNLIFRNFADGMSMLHLASYVNSLKITTKKGNPFENRTIDYILNNPVYIGKARWTPTGKTKRDFKNPDTIIKDSNHEPIIDMELWDKAQERIKANKEIYRRHENKSAQIKSWLKGLVRCSACGNTLIVYGDKYMQCNGYLKGLCKQSAHIKISELENAVLEELQKTYSGQIELTIVPKTNDTDITNELELLEDKLSKIPDKEERIQIAYEDGIDTIDEYKANKERLQNERETLKNALVSLREGIIQNRQDEGIIKQMTNVYELLTDEAVDMEIKFETARVLIQGITYSKPQKLLQLEYK